MSIFQAPQRLATDAFVIRPYATGDAEELGAATVASYEHLKTYMPWANPTQSLEVSEALVEKFMGDYTEGADFVLGIWAPGEVRLLGGTGFHLREGGLTHGSAEVGMWIRSSHAGQGFGTSVLRALVRWAFTDWPWYRLAWRCNVENIASVRCAEAAGFTREGTERGQHDPMTGGRRDLACFSLLKPERGAAHTTADER